MAKDITDEVIFGGVDGDLLALEKCACGKQFDHWDFILNADKDEPNSCPRCKRKLYFKLTVTVLEV